MRSSRYVLAILSKRALQNAVTAPTPGGRCGAPQTFQPVVRSNRDTGEHEVVLMRWGPVPYWSKDEKIGLRRINAKPETVTTAPRRSATGHPSRLVKWASGGHRLSS
jgi:putative SOS response-associated peptidase YedK